MIYFKYERVEKLNLTGCFMETVQFMWVLATGLFSVSKIKIIYILDS